MKTKNNKMEETLEEVAEIFVKNRFTKQICNDESYPDIYASKEAIVESHILFAKWQQENSNVDVLEFEIKALKSLIQDMDATIKSKYSEEEVFKMINDFCFDWNYNYKGELSQKEYLIEWFEKLKK